MQRAITRIQTRISRHMNPNPQRRDAAAPAAAQASPPAGAPAAPAAPLAAADNNDARLEPRHAWAGANSQEAAAPAPLEFAALLPAAAPPAPAAARLPEPHRRGTLVQRMRDSWRTWRRSQNRVPAPPSQAGAQMPPLPRDLAAAGSAAGDAVLPMSPSSPPVTGAATTANAAAVAVNAAATAAGLHTPIVPGLIDRPRATSDASSASARALVQAETLLGARHESALAMACTLLREQIHDAFSQRPTVWQNEVTRAVASYVDNCLEALFVIDGADPAPSEAASIERSASSSVALNTFLINPSGSIFSSVSDSTLSRIITAPAPARRHSDSGTIVAEPESPSRAFAVRAALMQVVHHTLYEVAAEFNPPPSEQELIAIYVKCETEHLTRLAHWPRPNNGEISGTLLPEIFGAGSALALHCGKLIQTFSDQCRQLPESRATPHHQNRPKQNRHNQAVERFLADIGAIWNVHQTVEGAHPDAEPALTWRRHHVRNLLHDVIFDALFRNATLTTAASCFVQNLKEVDKAVNAGQDEPDSGRTANPAKTRAALAAKSEKHRSELTQSLLQVGPLESSEKRQLADLLFQFESKLTSVNENCQVDEWMYEMTVKTSGCRGAVATFVGGHQAPQPVAAGSQMPAQANTITLHDFVERLAQRQNWPQDDAAKRLRPAIAAAALQYVLANITQRMAGAADSIVKDLRDEIAERLSAL